MNANRARLTSMNTTQHERERGVERDMLAAKCERALASGWMMLTCADALVARQVAVETRLLEREQDVTFWHELNPHDLPAQRPRLLDCTGIADNDDAHCEAQHRVELLSMVLETLAKREGPCLVVLGDDIPRSTRLAWMHMY